MPVWVSEDRRSYRLEPHEVPAVFGLSGELGRLVLSGLAAARRDGRLPAGVDPVLGFYGELKRKRKDAAVRFLLGFGAAAPLGEADRVVLAERMHVSEGWLACDADPCSLYELSCRMSGVRDAMGEQRRVLARGLSDPARCLNVLGMVSTQRPVVASLKQVLHCAWRTESAAADVAGLVERWPDAVAGR